MGNSKNIVWINLVRALSIVGVYFVHSQLYYGYMFDSLNFYILPIYVNAFFFVSGYLLFRKYLAVENQESVLASNILFRIVVPSIIFSTIEFVPSHVFRGLEFDVTHFLYKTVGGCTYWFTSALALVQLFVVLLLMTRVRNIWFYFLSLSVVFLAGLYLQASLPLSSEDLCFPWKYRNAMLCAVFVGAGGLYCRYEQLLSRFVSNGKVVLCLLAAYIFIQYNWHSYFKVLVSTLNVNIPGVFISLFGTMVLIELCKRIPNLGWLDYVGRNSIGFYFMSGALPITLGIVMNKLLPEKSFTGFAVVFFLSLIIATVAVRVIKRFFAWLFDIRLLFDSKNR